MYEKRGLYDYFCNRRKRDQSVETNLAAGGRSERPVQFTGGGEERIESELLDGCVWLQHAFDQRDRE